MEVKFYSDVEELQSWSLDERQYRIKSYFHLEADPPYQGHNIIRLLSNGNENAFSIFPIGVFSLDNN